MHERDGFTLQSVRWVVASSTNFERIVDISSTQRLEGRVNVDVITSSDSFYNLKKNKNKYF